MLKSELIDKLHTENQHLTRADTERVVSVILETITQTLEKGARVELRGFGAFSVRHRKSRSGRNPRTGGNVLSLKKVFLSFEQAKIFVQSWMRLKINNKP